MNHAHWDEYDEAWKIDFLEHAGERFGVGGLVGAGTPQALARHSHNVNMIAEPSHLSLVRICLFEPWAPYNSPPNQAMRSAPARSTPRRCSAQPRLWRATFTPWTAAAWRDCSTHTPPCQRIWQVLLAPLVSALAPRGPQAVATGRGVARGRRQWRPPLPAPRQRMRGPVALAAVGGLAAPGGRQRAAAPLATQRCHLRRQLH
jgi:hypothetical protein